MLARVLLAAALAIGLSAPLQAQYNYSTQQQQQQQQRLRQQQQQQQQLLRQQQQAAPQPADIQGVVEGVMQGGLLVLDATDMPWRVVVQGAKVQVTGTATVDYLHSGLIVEFKGEIDDHGALKGKIGELTLVSLSQDKQLGLFASDAISEQVDGAKPAKSKRTAGKSAPPSAGAYRIVGKLVVLGSKLSVQAGRNKLQLELDENPKINVSLADYTIAAKGDKISFKGIKAPSRPGQPGMAQASEVQIELAEPLAGVKKKGGAKADSKRSPKRPTKDEGLPQPAADK